MANKSLFQSQRGEQLPAPNAVNHELAPAYAFSPKHALAQYAVTGCLTGTFYASAEAQLDTVLKLCRSVPAEFVAKTAIYCRKQGFMKDMPALLCASLATRGDSQLLRKTFEHVIDDGKMLRNFVQILRSGVTGRKSLGSSPKRLVQHWFEQRSDEVVFRSSIGQSPSLADVIKMVHPRPANRVREALYGYLLDREHDAEALPHVVRKFEAFKTRRTNEVPDVPFQMLTALPLGESEWCAIARQAPWQMTRMNLNTFARHGVFNNRELTARIAARLRNEESIKRARVFPYQLMAAYASADSTVPKAVREALQDAMEIAIQNVPRIEGKVWVFPDVSGSMQSPVTGFRPGATSAVRCMDVAALVAAAILRKNRDAEVIPFEHNVVSLRLNGRDSVMTNAAKLAKVGGGGTNCSAPLAWLNQRREKGDLIVYVSDNESWVDAAQSRRGSTATMQEWSCFKARNPRARMACIDIQPYGTTQAAERGDILNIGGFSDAVFSVISSFAAGELDAKHWVDLIEATNL
ncbi:TROVE domain-containing protein [Verrucomicrobiota bacterium sgz303538]